MYFLNGCSLETQIVGAFCLPCILCAVCFSFFTESATPNSELAATPGKGLRTPLLAQHSSHTSTALEQLLLGLTGLCLTAGQSTYNTLLETYAQDFLGWSSSEASRALIAFFGAFATGSIGSAIMLDKKVQPVTLLTWFSLVLVVSTSAPLLSLSLSGLFWASTMLTGFAYGFLFGPVLEATHEWYGGSGAALLPLSSGMNIGGALGPFVTDTCMGYTDVAFLYITTAFSVALFCAILLAHLLHTAVNASP
jgi:Na+/melibiose symporter-like transporter